jgi:hypothetical protein
MNVFLLSPRVVFRARVASLPLPYPMNVVNYDTLTVGSAAAVHTGMTVRFGSAAGLDDCGRQRINQPVNAGSSTTGSIFFGTSSQGTHDGEVNLSVGTYIEVLDDYRVWAKIPSIQTSGTTTTIRKDGYALPTGNVESAPPVANAGPGFAATIDPVTHRITHSWDADVSFQLRKSTVTPVSSVTSYLWDVVDGTITVGTSTSADITVTFPAGFRYVRLTVTNVDGKSHTAVTPVFARDPAADVCIPHQITSHRITPTGQVIGIKTLVALPRATYPDGTLVMIWEDVAASVNAEKSRMIFVGWHQSDQNDTSSQASGTLRDSVLTCVDVVGRLQLLPGFTQQLASSTVKVVMTADVAIGFFHLPVSSLTAPIPNGTVLDFGGGKLNTVLAGGEMGSTSITTNPVTIALVGSGPTPDSAIYVGAAADWFTTDYPTQLYYAWYLLYWHSTALEVADLLLPGDAILAFFQFLTMSSDQDTLYRQVADMASIVTPDYQFNCNRAGQMLLVADPNLVALSDRVDPTVNLNENYYLSVSFKDERPPKVGKLITWAVVADHLSAVSIKCIAPGLPGGGEGQGAQFIETSRRYAETQTDLNQCEGNRYAKINDRKGPVSLTIPWPLIQDLIDPATLAYVGFVAPTTPRLYGPPPTTTLRGNVTEIAVQYDVTLTGTVTTATVQWQEETSGLPAVTVVLNPGDHP